MSEELRQAGQISGRTIGWAELPQWLIEYQAFVLLGIAVTYAVLFVPFFATERNITQMTTQFSIDGIISIGLTILMIAWAIDLGVGATMAFGGVKFALAQDFGVLLAALLGILAGAGVGMVNGFIVTKMKVNFSIATLLSMVAVQGMTFIITDETTFYGHAEGLGWMGSAKLWIFEFPGWACGKPTRRCAWSRTCAMKGIQSSSSRSACRTFWRSATRPWSSREGGDRAC